MSTILEQARASVNQTRGNGCTVKTLLSTLPNIEQADVNEALKTDAYGSTIAQLLNRKYGTRLTGQTIQRHRRGINGMDGCQCE